MRSTRSYLKHPPKHEQLQRAFFGDEHRSRKTKIRKSPSNSPSVEFTWQTGLIIFLLLSSQFVRAGGTKSPYSKARTESKKSPKVNSQGATVVFDTCPDNVDLASENPGFTAEEDLIAPSIVGNFTEAEKEATEKKLLDLRSAHPAIKHMINTVLSSGIQILLASLSEINTYENKEFLVGGFYNPMLRFIVVPTNATSNTVLHEFRHAFWHTYHIAQRPSQLTTAFHNSRNNTADENKEIDGYFKIADERIRKMLEALRKEDFARFFNIDLRPLHEARKLLANSYQHYTPLYKKTTFIGEEKTCQKYLAGSAYGNSRDLVVHSCTVRNSNDPGSITTSETPFDYLEILTNEPCPLEDLLKQVIESNHTVTKYYHPTAYFYEREAFLYGILPIPLLEYFYPELLAYTGNLTHNLRAQESAFPKFSRPILNFTDYREARLLIGDIEFIKKLAPEEQISVAASQSEELSKAGDQYRKQLLPILKFLWTKQHQLRKILPHLIETNYYEGQLEGVVKSYQDGRNELGKIELKLHIIQMVAISLYKTGRLAETCDLTIPLLRQVLASKEQLVQEDGEEYVEEYVGLCEELIRRAGCGK